MSNKLEINVGLQILKPVSEVFEAIVDPGKMSNYFISKSSGRIEEGNSLTWNFPEFNMDVPVKIGSVEKDKLINYSWDDTSVEIHLTSAGENATVVRIVEKDKENNDAGINWLKGNTEGWANFLACLKAFVEHGINLRKNAFDFRREEFSKLDNQ